MQTRPLILKTTVALLLVMLCCAALGTQRLEVSAQGPTGTPAPATPTPGPVQQCAECHLDVVAGWQDSTHAKAYVDPKFQEAWKTSGDRQCLGCHTTGFDSRTGMYTTEGVTCEACHGQTPAEHPPQPVALSKGIEVCAGCHTTTVAEWKRSAHGSQQLACTTCHSPHPQKLRFETADALCLNCHTDTLTSYTHTTHTKQACVDCHWYRSVDETQHVMTGNLLPTGHDNEVQTRTCIDCHKALPADQAVSAEATPAPAEQRLTEIRLRNEELAARVQSLQAEEDNLAAVRVAEGLVLGFVLGGAIVMFALRFGMRRERQS